MEYIAELFKMDISSFLISIFLIMSGIISMVTVVGKFSEIIGKPVRWIRKKNDDHELLISTIQNLSALSMKHEEDVEQSIRHDKLIKETLAKSVRDIQTSIEQTQTDIKLFSENRIHDREQSFQIQKSLTESIKSIADSNSHRDDQIHALLAAQRESLADRINQKYKHYISIKGIPEDEVEEFTNLHIAYKGVGGNHSGDAKYDYCMKQLPMIPVEVKLLIEDQDRLRP